MQNNRNRLVLFVFGIIGACFLPLLNSSVFAVSSYGNYTQESEQAAAYSAKAYASIYSGVITHFDSTVELNEKGDATITEYITIYFDTAKHGYIRWIPNEVTLPDGTALKQPVKVLSVTYHKLPYQQESISYQNDKTEYTTYSRQTEGAYEYIKIGDPDVTITGAYQYVISYQMKQAIRFNNKEYQELYLNITGDKQELPVLNASATVTAPSSNIGIVCYTGVSGATSQDCTSNTKDKTVRFITTKTPAEGLTVGLKYSNGSFTGPTVTDKLIDFIYLYIPLLIPLVAGLYTYKTWSKFGKDTEPKAVPPIYMPTEQMKKLNFSVMASLLAMQYKNINATAELIELARRNLLTIVVEKGKTALEVSAAQREELTKYLETQPAYLEQFVKLITNNYSEYTDLKSFKSSASNASQMQSINSHVNSAVDPSKLFTEQSRKARVTLIIAMVLTVTAGFILYIALIPTVVTIVSVVLALIFFGIGLFGMLQRSEAGNTLYQDLLGLKRYIQTAEIERLEFFNNPKKLEAHFEEILPYAVILGLDKQWNSTFADTLAKLEYQPTWLRSDVPYSNMMFLNTFSTVNSAIASSVTSLATPPSSGGSSFGGGGGFSGGGSGGGGGGSW